MIGCECRSVHVCVGVCVNERVGVSERGLYRSVLVLVSGVRECLSMREWNV